MRVVSWNCQGGFRNKIEFVTAYNPDILVIQESEDLEHNPQSQLEGYPNIKWFGRDNNKNFKDKGVLVAAKSKYSFALHDEYQDNYRYIIPLKFSTQKLNLFAIWAKYDRKLPYIEQVNLALKQYENLLRNDSIIIGDFNSNQRWNDKHGKLNHTNLVEYLGAMNMRSLYHERTKENQGGEKKNTYAQYRSREIALHYHIDYCFASKSLVSVCTRFEIDEDKSWLTRSDHFPIIVEFNNE